MADRYDAIVIGAGPVGQVCAGELADGGMRVAIVERELVGGECSYWACIPSKTLLRPGEAVEAAREVDGAAEAVTGAISLSKALEYRDFMTSSWDDTGAVGWLDGKGIDLLRGEGRIVGPGAVAVGDASFECDQIVVATGSSPVIPPIDGLRGLDGVWTNREATAFKELPSSLVVLGGGPVGVELAQAFRRFGSEVTVCEGESRLLPREPEAVGEAVGSALSEEGITLRLGEHASSASRASDGRFVLTFAQGDDVSGEKLLVATGRRARVDSLGLETVGITPGKRGIEVDASLRAGDRVWAIGDATGIMPFTHVGKYQARVAARAILGDSSARADYRAVPRVVFCDPQVAAVGDPSGGSATGTAQLSGVARTATYTRDYASKPGFLSLVSDGSKLVGAYAVGPEAGEWLQQATLAIRAEVPLDVLRDTIQPFPTFSEAFVNALADLGAP
jgi:pyruvate/2-oxoglutarate dehydrogenase complex dihydrolipoamide dehydrogenase (E3) component